MSSSYSDYKHQVNELIRNFEVCLRSGYSLIQCFEIIGNDLEDPIGSEAKKVSEQLKTGVKLNNALDNWLEHSPNGDLDLFVATIKVQQEVGGNLADKFRLLNQILAHRKGI